MLIILIKNIPGIVLVEKCSFMFTNYSKICFKKPLIIPALFEFFVETIP